MWIADRRDELSDVLYAPDHGAFGRTYDSQQDNGGKVRVYDWVTCREEFHEENRHLRKYYYCHGLPAPSRGRAISVFLDKIEDRLGLTEAQRTKMGPTNKRGICWVEVSAWWRGYSLRRSLFTALLKDGRSYRISLDNFEQTLADGLYTRPTRPALERFLGGNTHYWGSYRGWFRAVGPRDPRRPLNLETVLRAEPKRPSAVAKGA